jgi:hypothetical protein
MMSMMAKTNVWCLHFLSSTCAKKRCSRTNNKLMPTGPATPPRQSVPHPSMHQTPSQSLPPQHSVKAADATHSNAARSHAAAETNKHMLHLCTHRNRQLAKHKVSCQNRPLLPTARAINTTQHTRGMTRTPNSLHTSETIHTSESAGNTAAGGAWRALN